MANNISKLEQKKIVDILYENRDLKYRDFHANLVPGKDNFIGVRLPAMRKIAKEISKNEGVEKYLQEMLTVDDKYYEEVMVQGLIIGYVKVEPQTHLEYIKKFVPKIDNWAICDSFCANLKFTKKNMDLVWDFLMEYLDSDQEYDVRFAAVMLMDFYIDDDHIDKVLQIYNKISHEGYYVKMSVAWGLSLCFIRYSDRTMKFFGKNDLDDWTYNKALQKCVESLRVDKDTKNVLRKMKRK